jgi:serine phosphatase RsbU (regulator of sigma subunit)
LGFVRVLLKTRENIPTWDRWFVAWMWFRGVEVAIMLLILIWKFDFNLVHALHRFFVIPETAAFIIFQFGLFERNNKLTHYVVIGTFFLQAGILASILSSNFFPSVLGIVNYFFQAGTMTQIIFFAIGLGYKIRQNEVQKQSIQAELIEQLRKNEELQSKLNQELEEEVKKRTLEIESQSMILRRQNRDIVESIEYARKIQEAILPSNDEIQRYLPESFILYKPKDIVSGDFYWFSHLHHKTFIAVVDCTGHGVPGAFMSLITNELLNEIINTQHIHQPDLIFDELRVGIRRNLNQDRTKNVDGLVISLCVIHHADQQKVATVQIGNSYNPVFYTQGQDLHEIKADRIQIGGFSFIAEQTDKVFTTKTIVIDKPTTFYLSTDGLPDQFGGVDGKKFTYKRFKTLALAIQNLPLALQREQINNSLTDWMLDAAEFQTDDILVMGFQILPNT